MIIGLTGKAYSGKDTFANAITYKFSGVRKASFAAALKESTKYLFKFSDAQVYINKDVEDEYWEMTPREVLQDLGLYYREKYGEDFLIHRLQLDMFDHFNYIVSDVRFKNEASWIKEQGGVLVHIKRPDTLKVRQHKSEQELPIEERDYTIDNTSSAITFVSKALKFYQEEILQEGYKEKMT